MRPPFRGAHGYDLPRILLPLDDPKLATLPGLRGEHNIHRYLKNNQKGTRRYSRLGCAAILSQQLRLIIFHCPREKTMLAASDVERFHSGHRGILFEHQNLKLIMSKTETFGIGETYIIVF